MGTELLKRDVILAQEYLAFTLLNLFDLFLTGYIFKHGGMEANGVAAFIYSHKGALGGPQGFAVYKFALVLVVIAACEGIALRNVRRARLLVTFGCLVYVFVVLYEAILIFSHITGPQALG